MKILLILFLSVSITFGAKYSIILDSRGLSDNVWHSMVTTLNDGSTYVNHSVSGTTFDYFDHIYDVVNFRHYIDHILTVDTADYLFCGLGVNGQWEMPDKISTYVSEYDDIKYLDKILSIVKTHVGCQLIVGDILPSNFTAGEPRPEYLKKYWESTKLRNALREKWCAFNRIPFVKAYSHFLATDSTIKTEYYTDGLHLTNAGSNLWGQLIAQYAIPNEISRSNNLIFDLQITDIPQVSTKKIPRLLELSQITNEYFWNNINLDGKFSLYINGTKRNRVVERFDPFARSGQIHFASEPIQDIKIKCGEIDSNNSAGFHTDCSMLRRFPLTEQGKNYTTVVDVAGGDNAVATGSATALPHSPNYIMALGSGNYMTDPFKTGVSFQGASGNLFQTTNPIFSAKQKFTISFSMYIGVGGGFLNANSIFLTCGSSASNQFRIMMVGNNYLHIGVGNVSTQYCYVPIATLTSLLTQGAYHNVVMTFDLTQTTQSNKVKVIIDSTDCTSSMTFSNLPTVSPTLTAPLYLVGYPGGVYIPGANFKNISIYEQSISVGEAKSNIIISSVERRKSAGNNKQRISIDIGL